MPPRAACWLLLHFGGRNGEAMLGDIVEQFMRGRSRLWFWQEAGAAVAETVFGSVLLNRSSTMKRAVVWTTVLTGVFSLGYLTAQSPLILREEMPSASRIAEIV